MNRRLLEQGKPGCIKPGCINRAGLSLQGQTWPKMLMDLGPDVDGLEPDFDGLGPDFDGLGPEFAGLGPVLPSVCKSRVLGTTPFDTTPLIFRPARLAQACGCSKRS